MEEPDAFVEISKGAACRKDGVPPEYFFPEPPSTPTGPNKDDYEQAIAREYCHGCEVRSPCLEYALTNRIDYGVWGGMTEQERRRIIKIRAKGDPLEMVM